MPGFFEAPKQLNLPYRMIDDWINFDYTKGQMWILHFSDVSLHWRND